MRFNNRGVYNVSNAYTPNPPIPSNSGLRSSALVTGLSSSPTSPSLATSSQYTSPALESVHLDILNHPVTDVLVMISSLLQKIIEANDALYISHHDQGNHHLYHQHIHSQAPGIASSILAFHGRNIPAISLQAYLLRILKYCPATNEVFLSLLVYFDRISKRANSGEFSSSATVSSTTGVSSPAASTNSPISKDSQSLPFHQQQLPPTDIFVMDSYNIHRLVIAGVTVASKFFSDVFYKNSRYAKVGGLPLEELNRLELQFLLLSDFRLAIPLEELQRYGDMLLQFWDREVPSPQKSVLNSG
ncbi:cyclin-domain-containing protein [Dipodascopsis uninucleata]